MVESKEFCLEILANNYVMIECILTQKYIMHIYTRISFSLLFSAILIPCQKIYMQIYNSYIHKHVNTQILSFDM